MDEVIPKATAFVGGKCYGHLFKIGRFVKVRPKFETITMHTLVKIHAVLRIVSIHMIDSSFEKFHAKGFSLKDPSRSRGPLLFYNDQV